MVLRRIGAGALVLGIFVATAGARAAPRANPVDACIRAWPEARYGALGYNHIVHIANGCDPPADCTVTTNVNPEPIAVTVPGHKQIEVTTWRGSPAREFTPQVVCKMRQ